MTLDPKSFITDKSGKITSVILDYETFKKVEELLLDEGLVKAIKETVDDEELTLEEAKKLIGRN